MRVRGGVGGGLSVSGSVAQDDDCQQRSKLPLGSLSGQEDANLTRSVALVGTVPEHKRQHAGKRCSAPPRNHTRRRGHDEAWNYFVGFDAGSTTLALALALAACLFTQPVVRTQMAAVK